MSAVAPWDTSRPYRQGATANTLMHKRLRHHALQRRVWTEDMRFVAIAAGRRSGKTDLAIHRTVRKALQPYPWAARFGLSAPTYAQAKRIFWRPLKQIVPEEWIIDKSESELRMELVTGSEIIVMGMDVPERAEGIGWDGFVMDEYANMKEEAWFAHVRPALAERRGWGWQIGVPEGRNHYYDLFEDYLTRSDCGAYSWPSSTVLPPEEIEQLRADLDERTFRQEMEASFEEATGRIYYAFQRARDVHPFEPPPNVGTEDTPWIGGCDFNVDPMCGVWGWETQERMPNGEYETHVWVRGETVWEADADTEKWADQCLRDVREVAPSNTTNHFLMHPDASGKSRHTSSTGKTDHSILRDKGFKVRSRPANPLRRDRYNAVNRMFASGDGRRRTHIHPDCKVLIRALDGLLYKEDTNEPDKKKCAGMDHPTDAYGYWIEKRHRVTYRGTIESWRG